MVVVVTRDVADRFRGFLAPAMLEIAPGVYTAPRMSKGVRERVSTVLADWHRQLGGGAILMTWRDANEACGQGIRTLGSLRGDGPLTELGASPEEEVPPPARGWTLHTVRQRRHGLGSPACAGMDPAIQAALLVGRSGPPSARRRVAGAPAGPSPRAELAVAGARPAATSTRTAEGFA
jgi:CRISPR-associated protein Cas2